MAPAARSKIVGELSYCPFPDELGGEDGAYVLVLTSSVELSERAMASKTFGEWAKALGMSWADFVEEFREVCASELKIKKLTRTTSFDYWSFVNALGLPEQFDDPRFDAFNWIAEHVDLDVLDVVRSLGKVQWEDGFSHAQITGTVEGFVHFQKTLHEGGYTRITLRESEGGELAFMMF